MPDSPDLVKAQTATPSTAIPGSNTNPATKSQTNQGVNGNATHSPRHSSSVGTPSPPLTSAAPPPPPPAPLPTAVLQPGSVGAATGPPPPTPSSLTSTMTLQPAPSLVTELGCSVRQLGKLKRFLATLQQLGGDISPDVGERVHSLILGLVSSNLSIEEFHQKIQEVTNYPMRPFVVPLLKSHLPLLQAEVVHFARMAKQTPQQYVRQHEQLVLQETSPQHLQQQSNGNTPAVSNNPPAPLSENFDIFQTAEVKTEAGKRRANDGRNSSKENGFSDSEGGPPPSKRHAPLSSPTLQGGGGGTPGRLGGTGGGGPPTTAGLGFRLEDATFFRERDRYERYERYERTLHRDFPEDRDAEDEWKNIHTMLSCILGMVEKTKRALAILQHRSQSERQEFGLFWGRRHLDPASDFDLKKRDLMAHYKTAEDRVTEVRRRADAVNEVKRQAVAELQKAVSAAESKASELIATERSKMDRLLSEARRQATEEALATVNAQEESTESCWNCGRKANETCSGCNVARYCGAFCQHKDWENHHRACGQGTAQLSVTSTSSHVTTSTTNHSGGVAAPATPSKPNGKRSPSPSSRIEVRVDVKH